MSGVKTFLIEQNQRGVSSKPSAHNCHDTNALYRTLEVFERCENGSRSCSRIPFSCSCSFSSRRTHLVLVGKSMSALSSASPLPQPPPFAYLRWVSDFTLIPGQDSPIGSPTCARERDQRPAASQSRPAEALLWLPVPPGASAHTLLSREELHAPRLQHNVHCHEMTAEGKRGRMFKLCLVGRLKQTQEEEEKMPTVILDQSASFDTTALYLAFIARRIRNVTFTITIPCFPKKSRHHQGPCTLRAECNGRQSRHERG